MSKQKKKTISIVVPCYNEENNVENTYKKVTNIVRGISTYNFEFVFVDNGSTDKTRKIIEKLAKRNKKVSGVFLSRNFGPEASAQACFDYAKGDAVIGIACDLQDPVSLIPKFIKKWEMGSNIVIGIYKNTQDDAFTHLLRKSFYKLFKSISNVDVPINASGVGLLDRRAVDALCKLPEKYRFHRGLRAWIGFKKDFVYYTRKKRKHGKSTYNLISYFKHAERGLFGFSYLVLDLMTYSGFLLVLLSFIFIISYLFTVLVIGNPINASIPIMLVIVFFGGVQLLAISIIGKYIQVIVEETKSRPVYIVDKVINARKKTGIIND